MDEEEEFSLFDDVSDYQVCAYCDSDFKDGIWIETDIMTYEVCSNKCAKKMTNEE